MSTLLRLLALASVASASFAQSPTVVLRIGDPIAGAGRVTDICAVEADRDGRWSALVKTDDPVAHTVILSHFGPQVLSGETPAAIGGASFASLDSATWDLFAIPTYIAKLRGGTARQAVMYGHSVQFSTGQAATIYAPQLPTGSTWKRFDAVQFSTANPAYLLRCAIDVPGGGVQGEGMMAVVWHGGSLGTLSHLDLIARENALAPGLQRTIESLATATERARLGRNGQSVMWSCNLNGSLNDDGCVYLSSVSAPGQATLLAREGAPSPVAGRTWGALQEHSVDLNSHGSWTLRGRLDGSDTASDEVLILDGSVLAREGSPVPATAPHALVSLGKGRGALDENGRVLWFGRWDDPSTPGVDEALFQDQVAIVRTGTTMVDGQLLVDIESTSRSHAVDPNNGHFVAFVGRLADGTRGVILLDQSELDTYCAAKTNSLGCLPWFGWTGQTPNVSSGSGFHLKALFLMPNQPAAFFYGTNGRTAAPFHGGRLCVKPPVRRLPFQVTGNGSGSCPGNLTFDFNTWLAAGTDPGLVPGTRVNVQLWYRDPGFAAPNDVGLTSALEFLIGP